MSEQLPKPMPYDYLVDNFADDDFSEQQVHIVYEYAGDVPSAYMMLKFDKVLAYKMAKINTYRNGRCTQQEDGSMRVCIPV